MSVERSFRLTYRAARRVAIAVVGVTVILLGVAMLVLPGPGLVTIAMGLGILGIEFAFARRWLAGIRRSARKAVGDVATKLRPAGARRGPPPAI